MTINETPSFRALPDLAFISVEVGLGDTKGFGHILGPTKDHPGNSHCTNALLMLLTQGQTGAF